MSFKGLVETLARALVDDTDGVEVSEVTGDGGGLIVELRVAPDDIGKVIGKDGRTAKALRDLLTAAAMKANRRVRLDILD